MGSGISLVMSCWNRTALFRLSCPTWLTGNPDYPDRTLPDEISIVNDGGATDLVNATEDMEVEIAKLGYKIPVYYKHRDKGHVNWSNPAVPHNWLVKQAENPVVLIIDPEVAFISDVLAYVHEFFFNETYSLEPDLSLDFRRRCSFAAGTTYAIQNEFMHAGMGMKPYEMARGQWSQHISSDPTSHQIIIRGGPAHECRAWWRDRYLALGGKDERYIAWGYEDLDMEHRNMRFEPKGDCRYDNRIMIVTYGHGIPPCTTGNKSTGENEQLWRNESPADGVANRDIEWGIIL
jgi:hypothetical protein